MTIQEFHYLYLTTIYSIFNVLIKKISSLVCTKKLNLLSLTLNFFDPHSLKGKITTFGRKKFFFPLVSSFKAKNTT